MRRPTASFVSQKAAEFVSAQPGGPDDCPHRDRVDGGVVNTRMPPDIVMCLLRLEWKTNAFHHGAADSEIPAGCVSGIALQRLRRVGTPFPSAKLTYGDHARVVVVVGRGHVGMRVGFRVLLLPRLWLHLAAWPITGYITGDNREVNHE